MRLVWIQVAGGGGVEQDVAAFRRRVEFVAVRFYRGAVDITIGSICLQRGGSSLVFGKIIVVDFLDGNLIRICSDNEVKKVENDMGVTLHQKGDWL